MRLPGRAPCPHHDQHRRRQFQRDADVERQRVAAGRIAQQPDHAGPERVGDLVDRRDQADQHAERTRIEFALHDQRRQRDQIADRKSEQRAGRDQRDVVVHIDDDGQRHRLADERDRRRQPLVKPVDHGREQHAADHRHRRQQRHRDRRALAPDHRIQKRDQVNDEADLREQHQRERRSTPRGNR